MWKTRGCIGKGVRGGRIRFGVRQISTKSRISTFHFQDSLPKLAVPSLEDTCKKYLYFSEPIVSPEQHAKTTEVVNGFVKSGGDGLQDILVAQDNKEYSSFYNKMWFDMYLESRVPLPLNFNPQLTFKDETVAGKSEQAIRAANLIVSSVEMFRALLEEKLAPDIFHTKKAGESTLYDMLCAATPRPFAFYSSYMFGSYPLDMSQYANLFSSTRIPMKGTDRLLKFIPTESKHIAVQHGGGIYTLKVLNDDLSPVPVVDIERGLRAILADKEGAESGKHVGLLTTMERDEWAVHRSTMMKRTDNQDSLKAIDSALFAVCLDDDTPETYQEVSSCMLHGRGNNRWFDKSFQLIVTKNGKAAVNFEHSWGDGVAVLRYFNEVYESSVRMAGRSPATDDIPEVLTRPTDYPAQPSRLSFVLDPETEQAMEKAQQDIDRVIESLDVSTLEMDSFSKRSLQKGKIGADGFMQMGFQVAHERMHRFTPATYESASTAAFKHGRTETIRSATPEAAAFAKAMCDESCGKEARSEMMRVAIKNHGSITKDALMGKGMDRHLFALRKLAEARDPGSVPEIFQDKTYQEMNHIILSTSTLSSEALFAGGFGPVNDDCYALAYGIADEGARCSIGSYGRGSDEFAENLERAFQDMQELV
uniref:Choline/carnitine acyltransferase domain-containing protein n=1 Tax=Mucochytrium quahogii TaxID=96639 RepID=A0A7S2SPU2_9STRA|mmetsp:Transcript_16335/g.26615  ORF Transcript_16335/g.26615 Transcript_16335/m.26615 type:complete len:648 (+) Transcript_16335:446-2389(+)